MNATVRSVTSRDEHPELTIFGLRWRRDDAVAWLFVGLAILGFAGTATQLSVGVPPVARGILAALPAIVIGALLAILLIRLLDPFRTRARLPIIAPVVGGSTFAAWIAAHTNTDLRPVLTGIIGDDATSQWWAAIAGPTTEETLKALVIVFVLLLSRDVVYRPAQGFAIGAFAGLGFQLLENVGYAMSSAFENSASDRTGAIQTSVLRAITGISSHWLYSGIVGVGLVIALATRGPWAEVARVRRIAIAVGLFLLSWGLHFFWNAPTPSSSPLPGASAEMTPVIYLGGKLILLIGILVAVAIIVIRTERAPFAAAARAAGVDEETLGKLLTRRARRTEYRAARRTGGRRAGRARKRELRDTILRVRHSMADADLVTDTESPAPSKRGIPREM